MFTSSISELAETFGACRARRADHFGIKMLRGQMYLSEALHVSHDHFQQNLAQSVSLI
jgi:hypothetical protein